MTSGGVVSMVSVVGTGSPVSKLRDRVMRAKVGSTGCRKVTGRHVGGPSKKVSVSLVLVQEDVKPRPLRPQECDAVS